MTASRKHEWQILLPRSPPWLPQTQLRVIRSHSSFFLGINLERETGGSEEGLFLLSTAAARVHQRTQQSQGLKLFLWVCPSFPLTPCSWLLGVVNQQPPAPWTRGLFGMRPKAPVCPSNEDRALALSLMNGGWGRRSTCQHQKRMKTLQNDSITEQWE